MKTEEYLELLEKYIEKAARFADGEEMTIYINQTDADKKEYLEKDTGMKLTISTEDFVGGIRAVKFFVEFIHILKRTAAFALAPRSQPWGHS